MHDVFEGILLLPQPDGYSSNQEPVVRVVNEMGLSIVLHVAGTGVIEGLIAPS